MHNTSQDNIWTFFCGTEVAQDLSMIDEKDFEFRHFLFELPIQLFKKYPSID